MVRPTPKPYMENTRARIASNSLADQATKAELTIKPKPAEKYGLDENKFINASILLYKKCSYLPPKIPSITEGVATGVTGWMSLGEAFGRSATTLGPVAVGFSSFIECRLWYCMRRTWQVFGTNKYLF